MVQTHNIIVVDLKVTSNWSVSLGHMGSLETKNETTEHKVLLVPLFHTRTVFLTTSPYRSFRFLYFLSFGATHHSAPVIETCEPGGDLYETNPAKSKGGLWGTNPTKSRVDLWETNATRSWRKCERRLSEQVLSVLLFHAHYMWLIFLPRKTLEDNESCSGTIIATICIVTCCKHFIAIWRQSKNVMTVLLSWLIIVTTIKVITLWWRSH